MNIRNIRENILTAREKRAALRQQCAEAGSACLSLSLNIPGYPKRDPVFSAFFDHVLSALKRFLLAHRVMIETNGEIRTDDEAGDFYLAPLPATHHLSLTDIKTLCETFEETHDVGRAIDIDLTDQDSQPVSSGKLKLCFLCDNPAIYCMREQTHSYQELRERITARMANYLRLQTQEHTCKQLAAMALKATLYEVSLSPKPGLVDRFDPGPHQDMDYFTFLDSSAALAGYFEELARAGATCTDETLSRALPVIRETGLKMEAAMFEATHGVNTQKGLIFLMGVALFAASSVIARDGVFQVAECRNVTRKICNNLVKNELRTNGEHDVTHGARCFQGYGTQYGGARQEAEEGFPSVFEHGLNAMKTALSQSGEPVAAATMNTALTQTLLRLMSVVNDTNILYRATPETLASVKQKAHAVLAAAAQEERAVRYADLIAYCQQEQISPGGAADLLAVTVFFYCVESVFA